MDSQFACKVCNITCTGPENFSQHMIGIKHLKKVRQSNLASEVPSSSSGVGPSSSSSVGEAPDYSCHKFSCALCQTVMSGPDQYQAHMVGKMHAKKVKQIEMMQIIRKEPNPSLGTTDASLQSSSARPETTNKTNEETSERASDQSVSLKRRNSESNNESPTKVLRLTSSAIKQLNNGYFECTICEMNISGSENVMKHLQGKKHQRKEARLQAIADQSRALGKPQDASRANNVNGVDKDIRTKEASTENSEEESVEGRKESEEVEDGGEAEEEEEKEEVEEEKEEEEEEEENDE